MAKRYIDEIDIYKLFEESNGIIKLHVAQIDELPRADVVEVKHGCWENDRCSNCGHGGYPWNNTKFCPKCGAIMDEGDTR